MRSLQKFSGNHNIKKIKIKQMKYSIKILFALVIIAGLGITGCLKDKDYDNGSTQSVRPLCRPSQAGPLGSSRRNSLRSG